MGSCPVGQSSAGPWIKEGCGAELLQLLERRLWDDLAAPAERRCEGGEIGPARWEDLRVVPPADDSGLVGRGSLLGALSGGAGRAGGGAGEAFAVAGAGEVRGRHRSHRLAAVRGHDEDAVRGELGQPRKA
eukprot:scaffold2985_cov229-Pinguiococcus_pyrenoidosus.AAC.1